MAGWGGLKKKETCADVAVMWPMLVMTQTVSTNAKTDICFSDPVNPGPYCDDAKPYCYDECLHRWGPNLVDVDCLIKNGKKVCV
ncbi:hypothetical protein HAX54_044570 [Datura stramonium]|uniref:Uncharacterized protein n=1 Tax=Datura stramonium TaxID=4076 RepID=A0ABS8SPL2_DATST|nr:hypothetical protein [Datura stramonium]